MLTFVAEGVDLTQFAMITLAASQDSIGVTLGGILGQAIASHISARMIALIG